jgi:tRNA(fMet)-specific endonuclease VapC
VAWLIDTNCWIAYLKGKNPTFGYRLIATPAAQVFVCAPVLAELLHGALKYDDPVAREARVRKTLQPYTCLLFDAAAATHYARIRHDLEVRGVIIGPFDMQIAAIALAQDLTVVTGNVDEFTRIPGLKVADWNA